MLDKIVAHTRRIGYHFGKNLTIGREKFLMRGYYATRLNYSDRHEPFLGLVLTRCMNSSSGAFIDVGVNVGQTLMKVLSIDRHRQYFGFEPQIGCAYFVDQFLRLNALRNATVLPIALSDSNKILTLYSHGQYDEMATIVRNHDVRSPDDVEITRIQARIGDEVLRELGVEGIAVIKIDVEGAELSVMLGLRETLRTRHPAIIFEVLPNFFGHDRVMHCADICVKNQANANAIYEFLINLGYSIFQISDDGAELAIDHFRLDDREAYIGGNYIARVP